VYPDVGDPIANYIAPTSADNIVKLEIPLFSSSVAAGFPSPAEDHIEDTLDLNDYMVERPDSTFMLRVEGESMKDIGILPNDILVVDRSLKAAHNKIVIAAIDGQLTVKRLFHRGGLIKLLPENSDYPEIELGQESDLVIWGVVIGSFRRFQSF
jgi:DNA polymerase V